MLGRAGRVDLLYPMAVTVIGERIDHRRWKRHLRQTVLKVPGVGRPLGRRAQAGEQVTGRVRGVRRDANGERVACAQLVCRVIGACCRDTAIDQDQTVPNRIIGVGDVVTVRSAPLLVPQLIGLVVTPGHAIATRFDDSQAVADTVERVRKAGERRAGRAQVGYAQQPAGVVVQVGCAVVLA